MPKAHAVSFTLPVYAVLRYWGVLVLSGCLFKSESESESESDPSGYTDRRLCMIGVINSQGGDLKINEQGLRLKYCSVL